MKKQKLKQQKEKGFDWLEGMKSQFIGQRRKSPKHSRNYRDFLKEQVMKSSLGWRQKRQIMGCFYSNPRRFVGANLIILPREIIRAFLDGTFSEKYPWIDLSKIKV